MPLKRLFASSVGGSWGADPGEDAIDAPCIRGTDFDYPALRVSVTGAPTRSFSETDIALRAATTADIIVEKSGGGEQQPVGRAVLYSGTDVVVPTNFAARLRPAPETDPRYVTYLLAGLYSSGRTRSHIKQTTGIQNLDLDAFLREHCCVPDVSRQSCIADFLDAETARIDSLVEKKRRLMELLDERFLSEVRLALRTLQAPTLPLKRRWSVIDCKHRTPTYVDVGYPVVSPGDATAGRLVDARVNHSDVF